MKIVSTQAAVLFESHRPLQIVDVILPDTLLPGQVLVELITSGICGAQINEIDAVKGPDKFLPHLLGHEGFARVVEVGPGVSKLSADDTVIMHWRPSSGIAATPPKYSFNGHTVNAGWVTTFNQHAIVSENRLTKVDNENFDKFSLPLLGCALTTALGVLENDANVSPRDSVLIFGFGGVGISLVLFAKFLKARKIVVVDIDADKERLAKSLGVDEFILFTSKDQVAAELRNYYGAKLPTLAIETSGKSTSIELCYEMSSDSARVILVGVPHLNDKATLYTLPLHFGKILTGSKGGGSNPDSDIPFILSLIENEEINLELLPRIVIPFKDINEGIQMIRNGINGRVVLDFQA